MADVRITTSVPAKPAHTTEVDGVVCDECGREYPSGSEAVWRCTRCEKDECRDCTTAEPGTVGSFLWCRFCLSLAKKYQHRVAEVIEEAERTRTTILAAWAEASLADREAAKAGGE